VLILKERASIIMQMMKACLLIFGYHFSTSLPLIEKQVNNKENGEKVQKVFLGSGKIWGDSTRQITQEEFDDLPFLNNPSF